MNFDPEPVFKRSKWGTQKYYYNPRNPIGLALIIITLLFTGTVMLLMANRAGPFAPDLPEPAPTWSPSRSRYEHSWPPPSSTPTPGSLLSPTSTPER
ncbi:hypothetical protein [Streptomyces sp. NBC_01006]|uniref:hypothetical protein n=1 Tax=Streptomyces sp. NBC_01006 TaxID=2903716 RepID=UPI00386443E5|nr:hypothetical protein OG509_33220 [Streptomyces sp. NBC_01006]